MYFTAQSLTLMTTDPLCFVAGSKDWQFMNKWHYMDAYTAFKTMYPRIATGTPFDPWRAVEGDNNGYQRISSGENKMELKPLYLELADTSE